MANAQTQLENEIDIIHVQDGSHFEFAEKDEKAQIWFYKCTRCPLVLMLGVYAETAQQDTQTQQQEPQPNGASESQNQHGTDKSEIQNKHKGKQQTQTYTE